MKAPHCSMVSWRKVGTKHMYGFQDTSHSRNAETLSAVCPLSGYTDTVLSTKMEHQHTEQQASQ